MSDEIIRSWTSVQETLGGAKKRAMRALITEYMSLLKEPPEGFVVKVEDPFNWDVGIYGPPSTPYWGGYFKIHVSFPDEYPFEPPKLTFRSRFWHPNVYPNGVVCMSILHDPQSEDVPSDLPTEEKWNPTLSVRTVLLSLISIIGTPNPDSPANVDATKMYRSWIDGEDDAYVRIVQDIVSRSKRTAERDGVCIPKTIDEYIRKPEPETFPLVDYDDSEYEYDSSESVSATSSLEEYEPVSKSDLEPSTNVNAISIDINDKSIPNSISTCLIKHENVSSGISTVSNQEPSSCRNGIPEDYLQATILPHSVSETNLNQLQPTCDDGCITSAVTRPAETDNTTLNHTSNLQQSLPSTSNPLKRRPPRLLLFSSRNDRKKRRNQ